MDKAEGWTRQRDSRSRGMEEAEGWTKQKDGGEGTRLGIKLKRINHVATSDTDQHILSEPNMRMVI